MISEQKMYEHFVGKSNDSNLSFKNVLNLQASALEGQETNVVTDYILKVQALFIPI